MTAAAGSTNDKIIINFGWLGPNIWNGGSTKNGLDINVVDLIFKGAKSSVSVSIPDNIPSDKLHKFPFTCRKEHVIGFRETFPDSLCLLQK